LDSNGTGLLSFIEVLIPPRGKIVWFINFSQLRRFGICSFILTKDANYPSEEKSCLEVYFGSGNVGIFTAYSIIIIQTVNGAVTVGSLTFHKQVHFDNCVLY
jgi:hypothetical protein